MNPKLLMSAFAIFIIGTLLALVCSGRWLLNGEINIFNALASFNVMEVQTGGAWNAPKTIGTYWDAVVTMLSWNYPFLDSAWAFPVKFLLWIVNVGIVWGFIQVFASILQGLVSLARSFLP